MPGSGRSSSRVGKIVGGTVALVAVVGVVALGWSFDDPGGTLPSVLGAAAAAVAIGWTLYDRAAGD